MPGEAHIERHLTKRVKAMGGLSYKFISPGNAGVPDRILILPTGKPHQPRVVFVELKAEGKKPTDRQRMQIQKLARHGAHVYVLDSVAAVNDFLEFHHKLYA